MVSKPTNKIDDEIRLIAVTQKQMAQALDLSTTRINQLVDEGILVRDKTARNGQVMLFESLKNFFLSKNVGDAPEVNYNVEKALYMKAKRELAELKLAKARGSSYDAKSVESAFVNMLTVVRTNLLSLPAKLAMQLEMKDRATIGDLLTEEIESCLSALSEFDLSRLADGGDDDDEEN